MKQNLTIALALFALCTACNKQDRMIEPTEPTSPRALNVSNTTIGSNVQEFNQVKDAIVEFQEQDLKHGTYSDFAATGFYLPPNTPLQITVDVLSGTTSGLKLLVGTYSRLDDTSPRWDPLQVNLTAGVNNIPADAYGGILWVRYSTTGTVNGKVRITFNSGHQRMPVFVKNVTTQTDWNNQLSTYTTPDVLLVGDRVYQVYERSRAQSYQPQDNSYVLATNDQVWDWENEYLGLDGSAPQHQLPMTNKIVMVKTDKTSGSFAMAATWYRTFFRNTYCTEPFTPKIGTIDGWGVWHEFGHKHQQTWTWDKMDEVTVNLFSLFIERKFGVTPSRLKRDNVWPTAMAYVNLNDANKDLDAISSYNGVDAVWLRLCMLQQLWLAYGDQLFINLHKKTRNDNPVFSNDAQKKRWFMMAICTLTNTNYADFFKKWGMIPPSEQSNYTDMVNMGLPSPAADLTTFNEDNITQAENGATYKIVSAVNNSSVLDLNSYTPVNGTFVSLWSANSPLSNNQKWLLRSAGAGDFYFKSIIDTTKVLDVGGPVVDSTRTMVWTYHGGTPQKWKLQYVSNGYYNIIPSGGTNKNLEVSGGSTANGTKVQIMGKNTSNAQKWKLVKL